jgi:hypothetical protein
LPLIIIVAVLIIVWFVTNKLSSRADTSKFEPQYDSNTTDSTCRELPGSIDVIAKLETTSEEVESLIKEVGGSINEKSEYQSEHNFSISVPIG